MKEYILIKLRSGEEIIASLMSKNRNGIKVMRPMQIRQVPFVDHLSGNLKAAVVMENWIGRTNENEVTIPNNWVGIKMLPSQEVIEAYERYMKNEDTPKSQPETETDASKDKDAELKRIEDEMNKMFDEMMAEKGITLPSPQGMDSFNSSMKNDGKDSVIVNFMFPPKVFKNMVEDGILDDLFGMNMMDEPLEDEEEENDMEDDVDFKPKPKRKSVSEDANGTNLGETGKESWGNSFRDWSPDPKDYM